MKNGWPLVLLCMIRRISAWLFFTHSLNSAASGALCAGTL